MHRKKKYINTTGEVYTVTDTGKVYHKGIRKSLSFDKDGYCIITLGNDTKRLHRLVAELFCTGQNTLDKFGNIRDEVDHIDFQRKNNRFDNLRWQSKFENSRRKKGELWKKCSVFYHLLMIMI